nr:hypothetical protein [Tanacetum cinerariifolium]
WDFLNCVLQKKDVITYPRLIKLIIADLMKKFDSIPQRLEEEYHFIKDDISLEYVKVFVGVKVPTIQPQSVLSTQGTHMTTPSAHRSPTLTTAIPHKKKRKQVAGETKMGKITEATLLSLALPKTAIAAEAQENVAKVQEKLEEEEIAKMVEGEDDEESYASQFPESMLNDDDDIGIRIEPGSHKEHLKIVDNDDDTEKEKKDDNKNDEKANDYEKKDEMSRVIHKMCRRQGYMIQHMEKEYVTNREFWKVHGKVKKVLREIIAQIEEKATDDLIEDNLKRVMANNIIQECDALQAEVLALVSEEFDDQAPQIIEELLQELCVKHRHSSLSYHKYFIKAT